MGELEFDVVHTPEDKNKPTPKAGRGDHQGRCWAHNSGIFSRACDECVALFDRDKAAWKCPDCGRGLIWKKARLYGMKTSCCSLPWMFGSSGVPVRIWGAKAYPDRTLKNFDEWKHKLKKFRLAPDTEELEAA